MEQKTEQSLAIRVSVISIVVNVVLTVLKFIAGILGHSGAMISDAVHSASDVLSTFVVIAGVKISHRASDKEHPYGHERMECLASILLACLLLATGLKIGWDGIQKISAGASALAVPGGFALIAAIVSIAVKEWMYWFTRAAAKKINSGALMADAWHHRSDALSSVGSFVGIGGAMLGLPVLDPIASVVICLFICKAAYDIFKDATDKVVDHACDSQTEATIHDIVAAQEGVLAVDSVRTRQFGNKIYVDVEIAADGMQTLEAAHRIAQQVHDALEGADLQIKHCMVHVNPYRGAGAQPPQESCSPQAEDAPQQTEAKL